MTSFTFQASSGVHHILSMGAGGGCVKLFSKGSEFNCFSDRTCDLYLTPVPALVPRNNHEFQSTTAILSAAVYFRLSSCTHLDACFTLI